MQKQRMNISSRYRHFHLRIRAKQKVELQRAVEGSRVYPGIEVGCPHTVDCTSLPQSNGKVPLMDRDLNQILKDVCLYIRQGLFLFSEILPRNKRKASTAPAGPGLALLRSHDMSAYYHAPPPSFKD